MKVLTSWAIWGGFAIVMLGCAGAPSQQSKTEAAKPAKPTVQKEEDDVEIQPIKNVAAPVVEELPADKVIEPAFNNEDAGPKVNYPTERNVYLVEAKKKNAAHPSFGEGNVLGFTLNGVQGPDVVVKRGETVTFQVRTGVQHDFYISTSPAGWGAAAFTDGVVGQFTYDGDVTVNTSANTPAVFYYQCRNHKSMGGQIVVVSNDSERKAKEDEFAKLRDQRGSKVANSNATSSADENKLKQKIAYAAMLVQIKGAALPAEQKKAVQQRIDQAKTAQTKGDIAGGIALADDAAAILSGKASAGPTEQELAEQKADFEAIMLTARTFQDAHQASYDQAKKEKRKAVDYDRKRAEALFSEAEGLAKQKKYKDAEKKVHQAERIITVALNDMLGSQTLVYEVKFDTPKDEYDYELKRYLSYEELIPVAIEEKKPAEQTLKLMQGFVDKAKFFRNKADESAANDNYPEALAIIRDATSEVRRGLMTLGVSM